MCEAFITRVDRFDQDDRNHTKPVGDGGCTIQTGGSINQVSHSGRSRDQNSRLTTCRPRQLFQFKCGGRAVLMILTRIYLYKASRKSSSEFGNDSAFANHTESVRTIK